MRRLGVTFGALALTALVSANAFGQINLGGGGKGGDGGGNRGGGGGGANLNVAPGGAKVESKGNANVRSGNANVQNKANAQSKANMQSNANRNNDAARRATNNANRDGVNIGGRDGINIDAGRNGLQVDSQRDKDRDNARRNDNNRNKSDRDRNNNGRRDDLTSRGRIGDSDWDRFGIGRLDNNRYRNYSGNQWRYQRYGNDWFYWMPAGYWMFYGNGRWNRYDADVYSTYYYGNNYAQPPVQQTQVVPANFNGPFYEDSSGFYYMNGNQRVYDPSIQRVATTDGAIQR